MSNSTLTWVGNHAFNRVNNIHDELKKLNVTINKYEVYDLIAKNVNEKDIIEKFKKLRNKRIKHLTNNKFFDIKF